MTDKTIQNWNVGLQIFETTKVEEKRLTYRNLAKILYGRLTKHELDESIDMLTDEFMIEPKIEKVDDKYVYTIHLTDSGFNFFKKLYRRVVDKRWK